VLPLLLFYLLPYASLPLNLALAAIFVFFGLTDFFDGYLARRLKQETLLGQVLDPLADKCLVYSTLIALLAVQKIYFYWVVVLVGREFFMMGLRLIALEHALVIKVSFLGKIKTAVHMALLTVLIANPYQALGFQGAPYWNGIECLLLIAALFLSLFSAWLYYRVFIRELIKKGTRES